MSAPLPAFKSLPQHVGMSRGISAKSESFRAVPDSVVFVSELSDEGRELISVDLLELGAEFGCGHPFRYHGGSQLS